MSIRVYAYIYIYIYYYYYYYLSNACLMRPRLLYVFSVMSRITTICKTICRIGGQVSERVKDVASSPAPQKCTETQSIAFGMNSPIYIYIHKCEAIHAHQS